MVELAGVLAGPSVGLFLAELGADIVKVEDSGSGGDPTRHWRLPGESPSGISTYFACANFGKRSVALPWRDPQGLARVRALATSADVVVASLRPGVDRDLGLDYASLSAANPALVYAWITGFGPDSPRGGFDALIQAEAGYMSMNGQSDGPPTKLPLALIDLLAAHQLKQALLLALWQRERTGRGRLVTVSLWDAALTNLANQASNFLMEGRVAERLGSEHPNLFPYGTVVDCRDGQLLLAVGSDRQFAALCTILAVPELLDAFPTNPERVRGREQLRAGLARSAAGWQRDRLLEACLQGGVPAGPIRDVGEVLQSPEASPLILRSGRSAAPRTVPYAAQLQPLSPPPELGAHTQEVLREFGLDEFP